MIRREIQNDNSPFAWLLIDQIAHARIAAELAQYWAGLDKEMTTEALIPTIEHHDDGWHRWDSQPKRDPVTGIPRDFTEMVPGESWQIWSDSIDTVQPYGPLAQHIVAEHFVTLAQSDEQVELPEKILQFVDKFLPRSAAWRETWIHAQPSTRQKSDNWSEMAKRAVRILQFFDHLSLLLCCGPLNRRHTIRQWCDLPVTLVPKDQRGELFAVEPWPFSHRQVQLEVSGRLIPACPVADNTRLGAILETAPRLKCCWKLEDSS